MKIHSSPGVDAEQAARDLIECGAVAIDDIGENLYDVIFEEIIDLLGHVADELDLRTVRVRTQFGPVFVMRNARLWSESEAKEDILGRYRGL